MILLGTCTMTTVARTIILFKNSLYHYIIYRYILLFQDTAHFKSTNFLQFAHGDGTGSITIALLIISVIIISRYKILHVWAYCSFASRTEVQKTISELASE